MAMKRVTLDALADINVTPMVDVMLVLLIIFMVITPLLQKGVSVDKALTHNPRQMPDAEKTDAVEVAITRDGKFFLNAQPVALGDITKQVDDLMQNKLNKVVFIKSDARAKYGDVVAVVDNVRAAGIEQLGLITEEVQPNINIPLAPALP
ncbi:MAG: biopolymer transporter ExbD [Acidobacteria bacterium]|nr:MAG: biopolymer transporter ExbD [Acidobacteriota bacterium]